MKKVHKALSIQVNLNGLSFCILNRTSKAIEHLHQVDFDKTFTPHELLPVLKQELSSKLVFSDDFSDVVVVHQNELSTLVPDDLFDERNNADYLKHNSKILKSDYIAYDDISAITAKNVYVPYVNINNYIFDTFGGFTYKHSLTVFCELVMGAQNYKEDKLVFINVNSMSFEMVVSKNGQLILTNIHQYFSKEDFIYFILFTLQQLNLDPNEQPIVLSGKIKKGDDLYELLYTYVRHIDFNREAHCYNPSKDNSRSLTEHCLILNSF